MIRPLFFFCLLPVCFALFCPAESCNGGERPNILFLFSDDQTELALGCAGNEEIHTPHLDHLASEGVRFTNHYNTTSICMASRCSVLTGLYEYRHGCNFDHGNLERRFIESSYPARLREAGYFTGFAGKVGFELQNEPFDAITSLFDRWAGGPGQTYYETKKNQHIARYADQFPHSSRAYAAWADDFFKEAKASGQPFCLSISFKAPHLPFTPAAEDAAMYAGKTFLKPKNWGVENGAHLSPQVHTSRAAHKYREWVNDYDTAKAGYYALITGVDAAVGMMRESLANAGLTDNTVIIFTSDNGYNCGAHGFGDKVLPYEEGSKSPLIIYDPRLPKQHAGKTCSALTGNVDMAATIFSFAGIAAPAGIDGKDLTPLLTNPSRRVREHLPLFNFWGVESAQSLAIVTAEWKYIFWYFGGQGMSPTEELFHLQQDRQEMNNLASQAGVQDRLELMRQLYDQEQLAISEKFAPGHGYEKYKNLFDRSLAWAEKQADLRKSSR